VVNNGGTAPAGTAAPATKKGGTAPVRKAVPATTKGVIKPAWIVAAAGVVVVVLAIVFAGGGEKSAATAGVPPEERKYMGRLLPAGYEEPKVSQPVVYDDAVPMAPVSAAQSGDSLSIPASELVSKRNVSFKYESAGGEPLAMIAYVKPSGKAFVGVSYCPPCKGEGQTIAADVTLTCDTCGTKRNLETGAGLNGPCKLYPLDELPAKVIGDRIVLLKADIDKWTPQPLDRRTGGA
jgi:nitrite reductase/ring-hydroxylating ferredoxin subunit